MTNRWVFEMELYVSSCRRSAKTKEQFIENVKKRYIIADIDKFLSTYWERKADECGGDKND